MKKRQMTDRMQCNPHPDAPHGFLRDASHNEGRYVCECEYWEPRPVAHVYRIEANGRPCVAWDDANGIKVGAKLYVAPPKRKWVGLTDEEIDKAWRSVDYTVPYNQFRIDVALAIEAKLKEKNTWIA